MRRLLSSSFRNRLFAAFLAASLIPLLLCSALLLQIFRLRMEDRTQAEADRYLDSAVQVLDQACQSLTSAAAALERDAVLSQALLQGSPTQGEVYRLFLEDVQSAQTLAPGPVRWSGELVLLHPEHRRPQLVDPVGGSVSGRPAGGADLFDP